MFVHIPRVGRILKCEILVHEWIDTYLDGLFGRENTTSANTELSKVKLRRVSFLAWLAAFSAPSLSWTK